MSWILALLLITPVFAQEVLDAIDVEASKDIEKFTFTTSETITTRELENQPVGVVSEELKEIPGLITVQRGGPGGQVSFFLRGTETRHISFTLDGLKINDTSNTDRQFDASFLTAPFIGSITVHKGPQAVLYGSDALGGMIEMKTRKGEFAPETRLTLSGGSFGTIAGTLASDWKNKDNNGTITFSQFHSDGISRLNDKRHDADERDATDITQLTSSSEHRWATKLQTDFLASYLHSKAEQDAFDSDNSNDFSRNDQYIVQQKTNFELKKNQGLSLRNGYNRHQRFNESLVVGEEVYNGGLLQNELMYTFEENHFSLLAGLSADKESAKAKNFDRDFDLFGAFIQTSWRYSDFKFHLGGRGDKHEKYGEFVTGSGGINYKEFFFQYSQGYKAPSLYQLYGPDIFGSPVGNPDLKPEVNHFMELSWKRTRDLYETSVTLFQNRLSNLFTFAFGKGYFNQQRYIAQGVEVSGKIKRNKYQAMASFTHQDFKDEDTRILLRPYNMANAGFSYFPVESVELNINGRWLSSRDDFSAKLNAYEVVDLGARKSWERDDVSLQLKNLFDREYEDLAGFSVMPRSLFANYSHRF